MLLEGESENETVQEYLYLGVFPAVVLPSTTDIKDRKPLVSLEIEIKCDTNWQNM